MRLDRAQPMEGLSQANDSGALKGSTGCQSASAWKLSRRWPLARLWKVACSVIRWEECMMVPARSGLPEKEGPGCGTLLLRPLVPDQNFAEAVSRKVRPGWYNGVTVPNSCP